MITIGFIGAGITGTSLAVRLQQKGYHIAAVSSRTLSSAEKLARRVNGCQLYKSSQEVADNAELVFITTPDDVIQEVATRIRWRQGQFVVHCSGAHSTDIIKSPRQFGATPGCFHPLQTFASVEQAITNLPDSTFAIEAEEPLLTILQGMATRMSGNHIVINANAKVLYHASAVFACNYLVTLVKLATDIWQEFGIPREQAIKALVPLLRGTIGNIENVGLPACLTGPIARGDSGTIRKHLEELENLQPDLINIYKQLGLLTIPIAVEKGKIDPEKTAELQDLLERQLQEVLK